MKRLGVVLSGGKFDSDVPARLLTGKGLDGSIDPT